MTAMLTETKKKLTRAEARTLSKSYRHFLEELAVQLKPAWRIKDKPAPILTWRTFIAPDPCLRTQGWKIHISAAAVEAMELCEIVVHLLVKHRATFKLPSTAEGIAAINSGLAGDVQVGKIITVYPRNDQEGQELVRALEREWPTSLGPNISSDLVTRAGGAIFFRFGSFGGGDIVVDSAGRQAYALRRQDGSLVADSRDLSGLQPEWAPAPPFAGTLIGEDTEAEVTVAGREYLPLMLLHKSARGKVTLALDLQNGANVVLKTAYKGTCGDLTGVDAGDRLRNEHDILQQLADLGRLAPLCLGINQSSTTVLAMEDLEGTSLEKLARGEQIASLVPFADALATLHASNVVHRDIKLSNCVREGNSIRLLDFELAAFAGELPAIADCGTRNYIPPEGTERAASPAGDVYALGICIAHALFGYDPAVLPHGPGRLIGLLSLLHLPAYARLVKRLLHPDKDYRPSAGQTSIELRKLSPAAETLPVRTKPHKLSQRLKRCKTIAVEAGIATRAFLEPALNGNAWRNHHSESEFLCEGISLGASGIALGLASIDQSLGSRMFDEDIRQGAEWLRSRPPGPAGGLFTGNAGVAVALAMAGNRLQSERMIEGARSRLAAAVNPASHAVDLLAGSAGIVWAGVLLADLTALAWPLEYVQRSALELIRSAEEKHGMIVWKSHVAGEADNSYTGAAHGSAGIAMALAGWGQRTGNPQAVDLASKVFRSIARTSAEQHDQKFPGILADKVSYSPAGHWCHGIAGYLWCLLQAFGDTCKLDAEIDWVVRQLSEALPVGNSTYCHGLAGQLETWRMLKPVARHSKLATGRAEELAVALNLLVQRRNGLRVWCSEEPATVTPDLWLGFLGPASALAMHTIGSCCALLSPAWLQQLSGPRKHII